MSNYLHRIDIGTGRGVIVIDDKPIPSTTYTYLNDAPIIDASGERVPSKNFWTLGPVETEQEAETLALCIAERYNIDVMVDGKLLGLPYMGKPGQWASKSEIGAALGSIKSERKAKSSANNGKLGGRPKKAK